MRARSGGDDHAIGLGRQRRRVASIGVLEAQIRRPRPRAAASSPRRSARPSRGGPGARPATRSWPPRVRRALGEHDRVAPRAPSLERGRDPGRAAAHDEHAPAARRRPGAGQRERPLAPGPRVHRARDRQARVVVADAALVAAVAGDASSSRPSTGVGAGRGRRSARASSRGGRRPRREHAEASAAWMREVAISGTGIASRSTPAGPASPPAAIGGGGTIQTEPR